MMRPCPGVRIAFGSALPTSPDTSGAECSLSAPSPATSEKESLDEPRDDLEAARLLEHPLLRAPCLGGRGGGGAPAFLAKPKEGALGTAGGPPRLLLVSPGREGISDGEPCGGLPTWVRLGWRGWVAPR